MNRLFKSTTKIHLLIMKEEKLNSSLIMMSNIMEIKKVSQLLNKILRKDQDKINKFKIRYDCYIN